MRNDVVFPDSSASDTNRAIGPAAGPVAPGGVPGAAAEAAPGREVQGTGPQGSAAGAYAGQLSTPPFSWLGDAAWPDFPG